MILEKKNDFILLVRNLISASLTGLVFTVLAKNLIFWEYSIFTILAEKLNITVWRKNSILRFWREIVFNGFGKKSHFAGKFDFTVLAGKLGFTILAGNLVLRFWPEIMFCEKTQFYGFDGKS